MLSGLPRPDADDDRVVTPVLVLLNGIPGSGKSTLARSWAARQHDPLVLAIDIDVVRGMLGRWNEDVVAAGLAARAMALAAIDVHLRAGRDVVVPQYLCREDLIDELHRLAQQAGARFVECVLPVDVATATARLASRDAAAPSPGVEGDLEGSVEAIHLDFVHFLETRPDALLIDDGLVTTLEALIVSARSD